MNTIRVTSEQPSLISAARSRLFLLVLALAPGCDPPGRPRLADKPVSPDKVVDFTTLFRRNCAACHGVDGKLGAAPPLNDASFLAIVPDSVLLSVISEGRPGTPMPAFAATRGGPLTEAQVKALADGIKPQWKSPDKSSGKVPPYSVASGNSAGDKSRGTRVFARACAPCHGPTGLGGENGGAGAINDPAFLALISDQALRRYAITGRPDLGMPGYAENSGRSHDYQPMTSAEIVDLVALLASWRQGERVTSSTEP